VAISNPAERPHVIAVVDDDPSVRKALARLLKVLGHRVEVFASAETFMSGFSVDAICLILDVDLGTGSGLDLARQLSESGLKFPIIFMTGSQDEVIRARCLDFGCAAFLCKPFSEDQLTNAIASALTARLSVG
jgi:FixJ family two-component response regulator